MYVVNTIESNWYRLTSGSNPVLSNYNHFSVHIQPVFNLKK